MKVLKSIAKRLISYDRRPEIRRAVEKLRKGIERRKLRTAVARRSQKSILATYPVIEPGGELGAETVILNTRHGYPFIITPKNGWIDQILWRDGSYELGTIHLIRKFLGRGETFFDIGANVGLMTIAASLAVGPSGRVVSFEPDHTNLRSLLENILLNRATNVCVMNLAVGDTVGEFNLFRSRIDDGGLTSLVEKNGFEHAQVVGTTPLDKMLDLFPSRAVSLVKIDVEGYEFKVIKGGQEFLSHHKPIVIMEFEASHGDGEHTCLHAGAILLSLGYDGYFGNGKHAEDTVLRLQPKLEFKKDDNLIFIHRDRRIHAQRNGIELS